MARFGLGAGRGRRLVRVLQLDKMEKGKRRISKVVHYMKEGYEGIVGRGMRCKETKT